MPPEGWCFRRHRVMMRMRMRMGKGKTRLALSAGGSDETDDGGIDLSQYPPGSKVVTDWKGEPMVITPGDKLPFVS